MRHIVQNWWLNEQESNTTSENPINPPNIGQNLLSDPNQTPVPNAADSPTQTTNDPASIDDPVAPDMPDPEEKENKDFEVWKKEFFDLSIKGDTNEMIDSISQIRDRKLNGIQNRFVEDNLDMLLLRQDANIDKASKEIRKLINQDLDKNTPAVSLAQHITNTLKAYPVIGNIFIKLAGLGAKKGDGHRKLIGALTGSVLVGGGGDKEDLIFAHRDYSINISTRFYTQFGEIQLGKWSLQEDDPEQYLAEPELERLEEGSPEEKRVLRRRVVVESIADRYRNRAFITHVFEPDTGDLHTFGWDVAESLRSGYKSGKFVIRKKKSNFRDCLIDDNGDIIPIFDMNILHKKETGEVDEFGNQKTNELPFMEPRNGTLYLTISLEDLQSLSSGLEGMWHDTAPFNGNPSDIKIIMRCIPSSVEILMRRC